MPAPDLPSFSLPVADSDALGEAQHLRQLIGEGKRLLVQGVPDPGMLVAIENGNRVVAVTRDATDPSLLDYTLPIDIVVILGDWLCALPDPYAVLLHTRRIAAHARVVVSVLNAASARSLGRLLESADPWHPAGMTLDGLRRLFWEAGYRLDLVDRWVNSQVPTDGSADLDALVARLPDTDTERYGIIAGPGDGRAIVRQIFETLVAEQRNQLQTARRQLARQGTLRDYLKDALKRVSIGEHQLRNAVNGWERQREAYESRLAKAQQELVGYITEYQSAIQAIKGKDRALAAMEHELEEKQEEVQKIHASLFEAQAQAARHEAERLSLDQAFETLNREFECLKSSKAWKLLQVARSLKRMRGNTNNIRQIDARPSYTASVEAPANEDAIPSPGPASLKEPARDKILDITYPVQFHALDSTHPRSSASPSAVEPQGKPINERTNLTEPAPETEYDDWLARQRPVGLAFQELERRARAQAFLPTIGLLIFIDDSATDALERTLASLEGQCYPFWQLAVALEGELAEDIRAAIECLASRDRRVNVIAVAPGAGPVRGLNRLLDGTAGEFVGRLEAGDELAPDALFRMVEALQDAPEDVVYSDEDLVDSIGGHHKPFLKPDWNQELLYARPYICRFALYQTRLVREVGGFTEGLEGAHDWDLALKVTERARGVRHVPRVLYHARKPLDLAPNLSVAERAIRTALQRRGLEATSVLPVEGAEALQIRRRLNASPLVSIIVPTRDHEGLLRRCLASIEIRTRYPHYEIIIADNDSSEASTRAFLADTPHTVVRCSGAFNYSRINNTAAARARGDVLVFLNSDTEILSPDWLEAMLELQQDETVGAVGAKLLYPDGRVQHSGVLLHPRWIGWHAHGRMPGDAPGYFCSLQVAREYSAVTAACLMVGRSNFHAVGGFDEERLPVTYNDVDLCLKLQCAGLRNVYTPFAELLHHESASRGNDNDPQELEIMRERWASRLEADAAYHPSLKERSERFEYDWSR